jgi:hypothetical protein
MKHSANWRGFASLGMLAWSLGSACAGTSMLDPSTADLVGRATSVHRDGSSVRLGMEGVTFLVGETPYRELLLYVSEDCAIYVEQRDGSHRRGAIEDLIAGQSLMVWSTGVEERSLPPRLEARKVVVLGVPLP